VNLPGYSLLIPTLLLVSGFADAQQTRDNPASATEAVQLQVDRLAEMVNREQAALESSQRQIELLRRQVAELQGQLVGARQPPQQTEEAVARLNADVENIRERQEVQQSEIATHEQDKVESASKFPVKVTGLILMNTFVNTAAVDVPPSPTWATGGSGTTGISLRQTVLGLDARGPHVFGASSDADVRMDFFGGVSQSGSYSQIGGLARLRTAHAELAWDGTRAFFALDRPIVSPNIPSSLTAIAQPALAWSGNLWNWMPQVGAEHTLGWNESSRISLQGAIADVPDPPAQQQSITPAPVASLAEQSRWPGSEARVGYARGDALTGLRVGAGGYFSPHTYNEYFSFDAWAATIDYRIPLFAHLESSGSFYRGLALGGLGGGAFKDYLYAEQNENYIYRPLDDVGGWTQLKARANERLEFNVAYGLDNAFAHEIRPFLLNTSGAYQSLARNATWFTNVIYSPTAYTLFSFEYRRIDSSYAIGPHSVADVYGIAGGYRF
jgi:phage FluMu protein gp41